MCKWLVKIFADLEHNLYSKQTQEEVSDGIKRVSEGKAGMAQ